MIEIKKQKLIFLHIGLHKTATTTIQTGLKLNVKKLLEDGYCYPCSGLIGDAQHNLVWEVAHGDVLPWDFVAERTAFHVEYGGFEALVAELRESLAERIIISSEAFENLSATRILELKNRLKEYNVRIIVYLRNQSEYYQSAWAQHIKSGLTTDDFSTWIDKTLAAPPDFLACFGDYRALLNNWSDVFGKENIEVETFENRQQGKHIFFRFLASCGIDNQLGYELPPDQNVAPGIKILELMRQMNKILVSNKILPVDFYSLIMKYNKEHAWDTERLSILTPQIVDKVTTFFAKSNTEVALGYFGRDSLFERETIREFNKFDISQLPHSELLQIITEIFSDVNITREEELHEHYRRVISHVEQKLSMTEQKLSMTEQKLSDNKSEVSILQENLNSLKSRSLNAVNELAGIRESHMSSLMDRFRRFNLLPLLNPAFQQYLDDSYIFQNVKGFLLQPSVNFQKVEYISYRLKLNRPGLCGIWIAPLLDIPLQQGAIGVELVSPERKIVLQQIISVGDLREDMPGHFIFEPVLDTQQGVWGIRIFARDVEGPIRLVEWRKYSWGGLGGLKTRAFFGFDFSRSQTRI